MITAIRVITNSVYLLIATIFSINDYGNTCNNEYIINIPLITYMAIISSTAIVMSLCVMMDA